MNVIWNFTRRQQFDYVLQRYRGNKTKTITRELEMRIPLPKNYKILTSKWLILTS